MSKKKQTPRWVMPVISVLFLVAVVVIAAKFAEKPASYVSGTIKASPEIAEKAQGIKIMFVTVFDADQPGPPYGAMREPINIGLDGVERIFYVTREKLQVMNAARPLPNNIRVKVRFDRDGQGGPDRPGDIVGEIPNLPIGTEEVTIEMTKVIE